ncbi:NB-ARC domain-containing protein [Amycolatopsis vastitatis]|uniref:NB-ARC domain-containing protein n=1 Tax=Amycolatopsis vastitatis TaxID=1905142 RepID=UPI001178430F|nr:NB-ARC domain-containing protein [Amycolatopsis vastitatis]
MKRKQAAAAAGATFANIAVAITINVLTSGWSWLVFVALAVLSAAWVGLEIWRATPRRGHGGSTVISTVPRPGGAFVPRPELTARIVRPLLSGKAGQVGITTGLAGAGGFGKTTLAAEVCERPDIKATFSWIDWVTVGQEVRGAALADTINDLIERIDGQRPGLTSPEQAGFRLGELLEEKGRSLLVVDDVWTAEQLRPFLNAGRGCTLLITTRIPDLLPDGAEAVVVDQMSRQQARDLVTGGLPELPEELREQLLDLTGRWPLALGLANGALRRAARDGSDVAATASLLLRRLQERGPTALDVTDAARRDRAVAATLESSLGVLGDRRDRVVELAIFPEDVEIPQQLVATLWQKTAGLSPEDGERLGDELAELSLVTRRAGTTDLRLHDIVRTYLRYECGTERLTVLHQSFLDAVAATLPEPDRQPVPWWTLPTSAEHLWRTLAYHLAGAERTDELSTLVTSPPWVIAKLRRFGPVAIAEDLALVRTEPATDLTRFLDQMGHLLIAGTPDHAVVNALAQRLSQVDWLAELREAALKAVDGVPRLVPRRPLPDLPDPALNRVLEGAEGQVSASALSPDGSWLAVAVNDGIRLWEPESGRLIRLVDAPDIDDDVLALSPDGKVLASADDEGTIRLWDTGTWRTTSVLRGHSTWLSSLAFSADGEKLFTLDSDGNVFTWDLPTGVKTGGFKVPESARACLPVVEGRLLLLDRDGLKLWNPEAGTHTVLPEEPYTYVINVAVSPDQRWIAAVGITGLSVYDAGRAGKLWHTLHHHLDLTAAAFSSDGHTLATGGEDGIVTFWDTRTWLPTGRIAAHGAEVRRLAFTADGSVLASTGGDGTLRLWTPARARTGIDRDRDGGVKACAAPADGSWLAVAKANSVVVYDPASAEPREELRYLGGIDTLQTTLDGRHLAAERTSSVCVSDTGNWQSSHSLNHPAGRYVRDLSIGGDIVCVSQQDHVVAWNIGTWADPVVLTAGETGGLQVHDQVPEVPDSRLDTLKRRFKRGSRDVHYLEATVAPSGSWIAVKDGNRLLIADTGTWKTLKTLTFGTEPDGSLIVPDESALIVHVDGKLQYWDTRSWTLVRELKTAEADAKAGAWSPGCSLLAVVTEDRALRILDARTWACLTEFRLDGEVSGCAWLSDDRLVAVGGHGISWFTYVPGDEHGEPRSEQPGNA